MICAAAVAVAIVALLGLEISASKFSTFSKISSFSATIVTVGVCELAASIVKLVPFVIKSAISATVFTVVLVPSPSTYVIEAISSFSNSAAVARSSLKSTVVSKLLTLS